jgi:type II secretory pathway pseudopilin PulG
MAGFMLRRDLREGLVMKAKQKGFTSLEILLLLIIIGIISLVGLYVYNSKSNTEATLNEAANTQAAVNSRSNLTKGWQTVKSPDGSYSFMMPKDWVMLTCDKSGGSASAVYIASKSDYLAKCQSDAGGEANFAAVADASAQKAPTKKDDNKAFTLTQVTVDKVKGYRAATTTSSQALLANTRFIVYGFYANGKSFYATYIQFESMPDNSKVFDQIVQTWKF